MDWMEIAEAASAHLAAGARHAAEDPAGRVAHRQELCWQYQPHERDPHRRYITLRFDILMLWSKIDLDLIASTTDGGGLRAGDDGPKETEVRRHKEIVVKNLSALLLALIKMFRHNRTRSDSDRLSSLVGCCLLGGKRMV